MTRSGLKHSAYAFKIAFTSPDNPVPRKASMLDNISLRADGPRLSFTRTSANRIEYENETDQFVVVLNLNGEVIESSLFIFPTNGSILVERSCW